jgi:hypothetical protein
MKPKIILLILTIIIFFPQHIFSKPRVTMLTDPNNQSGFTYQQGVTAVIPASVYMDPNNARTQIWNKGIFNQNIHAQNSPGFEWPKGSGKFALFTTGLSIGAYINGILKMAAASYSGEYAPGYIENGIAQTDPRFKIYSVRAGDNESNNPDYANWGQMVPFGAPFVDKNENGIYDAGDEPGIADAGQTIFICLTDGFQEEHNSSEGFGGGTTPMMAEVRLTAWAYNITGIDNMQFIRFEVINKNTAPWDSTFFGVVVDPDLGDAADDWIGCDTTLNLGFCYNSDNSDGDGNGITYGINPPAVGMSYFRSPINKSVSPPDTLGLTSFVYFTNPGSGQAVCEQDPDNPDQAYRYLKGLKSDGTSWLDPTFNPPRPTVYCYPGDPESGTGWNESFGRINNCGGATSGNLEPSPGGDRRFIFNSGSGNFTVNPGDTQIIVLAQFIARGSNNLNSVTKLKDLSRTAQKLFDANFNVVPPPPVPVVKANFSETSAIGTCNITLTWGDTSESYIFWDSLFRPSSDTNIYKFQGYEVYELKKSAPTIPDLLKPETINDDITLIDIFDVRDGIGVIQDSLSLGFSVGNLEQFGYFPVIPPYRSAIPAGFPDKGISRSITISRTNYPDEYGGRSDLIYGQTYKYIVVAYAYSPKGARGLKVIRNPVSTSVVTVTPVAPLAGTEFQFRNNDTIPTNRPDWGVMPIIRVQEDLIDAKYRIVFQSPDTTYNVLRSLDNGSTFQTMQQDLKFVPNSFNLSSEDSALILDGIYIKVNKITLAGVIRDRSEVPENQARLDKGWEYIPEGNRYLTSADTSFGRPYDSESISLTYPNSNTFNGRANSLTPDKLRKIKIVYTGYGNGQMAFRYLRNAINPTVTPPADPSFEQFITNYGPGFPYQDLREVPFKVYEIDETDGTPTPRQLNVAFTETNDSLYINGVLVGRGKIDGKWEPTSFKSGGFEMLYIFDSDYDPNSSFYPARNLFINQTQFDIQYVWAPKQRDDGPQNFSVGDEFIVYPYTVTRPEISEGVPLYYEFESKKAIIGSNEVASSRNDMDKIRVVPNPYYGYNMLESSSTNRFVTFRRLPKTCSVKIYTLNGDMIKKLEKNNDESDMRWNLRNTDDVPVASGMYIVLIDAPAIGQKIIKLAVFTPQERVDF